MGFRPTSLLLFSALAWGQTETPATLAHPIAAATLDPSVEIVLRTSRQQTSAEAVFAILADVKNNSPEPVWFLPRFFTMIVPPEIDSTRDVHVWYAMLPGDPTLTTTKVDFDKPVVLAPGSKITAFWGSRDDVINAPSAFSQALRFVNFSPGDYTIKVVASYWSDEQSAKAHSSLGRHTQTAEIKMGVVAPQSVILSGAILGGLIAYFLLPALRLKAGRIELSGLITAALLSTIVTILLARISETQFLVRITVADLWGSIAMGFIASASGPTILRRFMPAESPSKQTKSDDAADAETKTKSAVA